ncbi:dentin sialophosphoprotein-like, partial [Trifolium medium]|nr:dentin sialophosphoprotein-like [Trifolium medium]
MAPSWFEQYGTFKNGKILPIYDAQKITAAKIMDQPFIIPNQSDSLHFRNSTEQVNSLTDAQLGSTRDGPLPASVGSEHACSQLSTPTGEPDLLILRPKKRKSATSELLSWHKEVTQGSERLRDLSASELLWAQTANRLTEKVEAGAGVVEDLSAMVKSKRRLVFTSQLMQQLLSPPPAAVLVEDVKLHHESVVYSVSRLTLGEVCSSISCLPKKQTSSDNVDHYILKAADFVDRT